MDQTTSAVQPAAGGERKGSVDYLSAPELTADFVLLYGTGDDVSCWKTTGAFYLRTREEMVESGYPDPRSSSYLCIELGNEINLPLDGEGARALGSQDGAPKVLSWLDVFTNQQIAFSR